MMLSMAPQLYVSTRSGRAARRASAMLMAIPSG
jgi:hypothetical protein